MNKTGVEYADYSWNPITGCFGPCGKLCDYCYAAGIARRFAVNKREDGTVVRGKACEEGEIHALDFPVYMGAYDDKGKLCAAGARSPYPYGFDPTFHNYRFLPDDAPASAKKPSTIFVGDMADMFGRWVPDEWIQAVFEACERAPQHRYLFLTKNPQRYINLRDGGLLPTGKNFWYGTTATGMCDRYLYSSDRNVFVSIEPIQENFDLEHNIVGLIGVGWVVIGADTSNRKKKIVPKKEWIERIVGHCKRSGVPVFLKDNLRDIWAADLIQEYPEGLR
jgi:protein gp37